MNLKERNKAICEIIQDKIKDTTKITNGDLMNAEFLERLILRMEHYGVKAKGANYCVIRDIEENVFLHLFSAPYCTRECDYCIKMYVNAPFKFTKTMKQRKEAKKDE